MCSKAEEVMAELLRHIAEVPVPDRDPEDISNGAYRFGPFDVGQTVRIQVSVGNGWFRFGGEQVTAVSRSVGAALAAWDRVDHTVRREGERWLSVCIDEDDSTAFANAYPVGRPED